LYVIYSFYIGKFHNIYGITKGIVIYSVVFIFVNSLLLISKNCICVQSVRVTLICLQQLVHILLQCVIIQFLVF